MKDALEVVRGLLAKDEYGANNPAEITTETDLKDIGVDSLDMVSLVFDLEDELDVAIRDDDYDKATVKTVGDVVALVNKGYRSEGRKHVTINVGADT